MIQDKVTAASVRKPSARLVEGAQYAVSAAETCVAPSSHFLLRVWEAGDAASGVTGSCAGSSSCDNKHKEGKQQKTTVHIAEV